MVGIDVVDEDGVLALRKRLTASLREEGGREDARVLGDKVTLRANELDPQALDVVEVELPAELLLYQLVSSVLVRGVERLGTDEHEDVGVVLPLAHTGAVAFELLAPVSPNRVRKDNASTALINSDDGVTPAVSCAAQWFDARIVTAGEHS